MMLSVAFVSCEDNINVCSVLDDSIIITGVYEVVYAKAEVVPNASGYMVNYLKYLCVLDFDNCTKHINNDSTSFTYSLDSDTISFDFDIYQPMNTWFDRSLIEFRGDTLLFKSLDFGTNLTIKAVKIS